MTMYPIKSIVPLGNGEYEVVTARFPNDPEFAKRIKELLGIENFNEFASSMHRR